MNNTLQFHRETGEPMMLNLEHFRRHLRVPAKNPKKEPKMMERAAFARLLGVDSPTYSRWMNKDHEAIRASNGNSGLSIDKRMLLINFFLEYKVSLEWLFTYSTEKEFYQKIKFRDYKLNEISA